MTIKSLLENDKINYEVSLEEFVKKYFLGFNLSEEQLKTKNEINSLLYYGFMLAINRQIKISLEEINFLGRIQYGLRLKNMKVLKKRLFKNNGRLSIFKFKESENSDLYSDIEGVKYIKKHFKDKASYDRFISFYSIGFWLGVFYARNKYSKIVSSTISGAESLNKDSKKYIKVKDSSLPEFVDEFNDFILNNKEILKLK